MYIAGDQLRHHTRPVDTKSLLDSAIEKYNSIITKSPSPIYNRFNQNRRLEPEMRLPYGITAFLILGGFIIFFAVVVLATVLFKRCPERDGWFAIIVPLSLFIIFITILALFDDDPVYT